MDVMNIQVEDIYTEGYMWTGWVKEESNWRFIIGNFDTLDEVTSDINTRLYPLKLDAISEAKSAARRRP